MTVAQQAVTGYGRASTIYRRAGWDGVLPLERGKKWPPPEGYTGYEGGWPSGTQIFDWVNNYARGGVALRLPRGVAGLDVDVYGSKRGDLTLASLEERYGPLPDTWSSTSRGDGPSRIYLYRCPETLELPGAPGPSIEFIQYHHRYCVVWPSVVEGRTYEWYDPAGNVSGRPPKISELAWLPDDWHHVAKPARPTITNYEPRAVSGDWSQAVSRYHAEGVDGLKAPGGRHDAMLPVILTLVRLDHDGHPGAAEALDDLHGRFISAVGDRATVPQAEGEWARMELGAVDKVSTTPSQRGSYEDLKAKRLHPSTPQPRAVPPLDDEEQVDEGEAPEDDADGWEMADLDPHLAGTYSRPQPTLLRFD